MEPKCRNEETPTTQQTTEGYDNEFVPDPESRYECPICLLILREPCQTKCGHLFCRDCILNSIRVSSNRCPVDNEPLEETDIYPDNFAKREILNLNIKCPNNKQGCGCIFQLGKLQSHLEVCPFDLVPCPNKCTFKLQRKDLDSHLASLCEDQLPTREHCYSDDIQAKAMENQVMVCPKAVIICPLCDEKRPRDEMEQHIQTECQKVEVHCPFYLLGCSESMVRSSIDDHIMCAGPSHMKQLCHAVTLVAKKLGIIHLTCQTRAENLQEHLGLIHDSSSVRTDRAPVYSYTTSGHLGTPSLCHNDRRRGRKSLAVSSGTRLEKITHPQTVLGPIQEASHSHSDLEKAIQEISSQFEDRLLAMQQEFEQLHNRFTAVEQENSNLAKSMVDLEQNIAEASTKLYNGDFCWCVRNFSQYRIKLEAGENSVLHSSSFYTSPWGYKLCVRASIEMSSGNEKQLSLFIHFMKSKNDDFLKWPFSGKITISVIDQHPDASKRVHVKETLEANPNLAAFQRPTTPRNHKGFGYINFLSIAALENGTFLLNDTLVIRVQVLPSSQ